MTTAVVAVEQQQKQEETKKETTTPSTEEEVTKDEASKAPYGTDGEGKREWYVAAWEPVPMSGGTARPARWYQTDLVTGLLAIVLCAVALGGTWELLKCDSSESKRTLPDMADNSDVESAAKATLAMLVLYLVSAIVLLGTAALAHWKSYEGWVRRVALFNTLPLLVFGLLGLICTCVVWKEIVDNTMSGKTSSSYKCASTKRESKEGPVFALFCAILGMVHACIHASQDPQLCCTGTTDSQGEPNPTAPEV